MGVGPREGTHGVLGSAQSQLHLHPEACGVRLQPPVWVAGERMTHFSVHLLLPSNRSLPYLFCPSP